MSANSSRLIGFLFLSQSLLVASTFRSWLPVFSFACMSILLVVIQRSHVRQGVSGSPSWRRRWLGRLALLGLHATIIGVTATWRFGSQVGESINAIYVGIDVLSHVALFCSLAMWAVHARRGHVSMLPLGLIVMLLCVAAGGASQSLAAQTTVALAACLGFALASQIILGAARGSDGAVFVSQRSRDGKAAWMGPLLSLLTLSVLMMATSAVANATNRFLPLVQQQLQQQLQSSLEAVSDDAIIGGTRYVSGGKLGEVRRHMLANPQEVALRVYATVTPGYLRGHAFDQYANRRWLSAGSGGELRLNRSRATWDRAVSPLGEGTASLHQPLPRPLQRFQLEDASGVGITALEIHNDPLKGPVTFLPLTTRWIEAHSRELVVTRHGVVRLGVDATKPYVAGVSMSAASETLESERRELLLDVPAGVADVTTRLADQVCRPHSSTRAKAAALSDHFQRNFSYSLNPPALPRGVDPLRHFLQTGHDAHCEFFASATVLTLRSAGVPTRYVTGYVADERSEDSLYFIARNRDAHAWAEAYDDRSGQWFAVESTPGRRYHTVDANEQLNADGGFFAALRGNSDDDSVGLLSRALGWLLSKRATDPLLLLFRVAQLPLFCVLLFLLWSRYWRGAGGKLDAIDQRSHRMLRQADRRLRRYSLVRHPGETLYRFADRIDALRADAAAALGQDARQRLSRMSDWYRSYADARYQGRLPQPLGKGPP
jgi:transglutaminase-like putative cysteine protease